MLSDVAFGALRVGATLAHALPTVRLRIRHDDRCLLEVRRPPFPDAGPPALTPCAFRSSVARAWPQHRAGVRLAFCGLAEGDQPAVDVGLAPGDATLAGGIHRVAWAGALVHAVATTLDADRCRQLVVERADPHRGYAGCVGLHADDATGVVLLHTATPLGDAAAGETALDTLQACLAACVVEEFVSSLVGAAARS